MATNPRPKPVKSRNGGTMTEAAFFGRLRSMLRRSSMWWEPIKQAEKAARRPSQSDNPRLKWEFQCAECKQWFKRADVQVDHIIPCGTLTSLEDIPKFIENLLSENVDDYQVICKKDHQDKTNAERVARKAQKEVANAA